MKPHGVGGRGRDDGGVLHRAVRLEGRLHARDGGALLADRDVDAAHLLGRIAGGPVGLLVDDRVDADRGLAGLAVADDQLTLAAADGGQGVDGGDAGGHRLTDRLTLQHGGGLQLEHATLVGLDLAQAVDRRAQRVDDAAEELVAHGDREHVAGAADLLALFEGVELTQNDGTDLGVLQVQRHAEDAARELQQLVGHRRGQAADVGDAVAGVGDDTDLFDGGLGGVALGVALDRATDLIGEIVSSAMFFLLSLWSRMSVCKCASRRSSLSERLTQALEAADGAAVDQVVAHANDDTGQQGRVLLHVHRDGLVVDALQRRGEVLALLRRQGHRGAHVRHDLVPERSRQVGQLVDGLAGDHPCGAARPARPAAG